MMRACSCLNRLVSFLQTVMMLGNSFHRDVTEISTINVGYSPRTHLDHQCQKIIFKIFMEIGIKMLIFTSRLKLPKLTVLNPICNLDTNLVHI